MVTETYNIPEIRLSLTSQGIDALPDKVITIVKDEIEYKYDLIEFFDVLGIE